MAKLGQNSCRGNAKVCPRHCERSEAIHSSACGAMDCFVAVAPRNDDDGLFEIRIPNEQTAGTSPAMTTIEDADAKLLPRPDRLLAPDEMHRAGAARRMRGKLARRRGV